MRASGILLLAILPACATRPIPPYAGPGFGTDAAQVRAAATAALELDGDGDPAADTLYAAGAVVLANGRVRTGFPRFAAVGRDGRTLLAGLEVEVTPGGIAWAYADYRWVAPERNLTEAGRATLLLRREESGWKIFHAHSSQVLPWQ